jgi:hypothetical protein
MEAKAASSIALRLLQIEQRFESYCTLYEEELREIKVALNQLREDVLKLHRSMETDEGRYDFVVVPELDSSEEDPEDSSVLTL